MNNNKRLCVCSISALSFFIGVTIAQATTYYVATTGLDSNSGTSGSPFGSIQKCIDVVAAGDTCTVANGTYTVPNSVGVIGFIRGSNANGTAGNPITLKSTNPGGARIVLTSRDTSNHGFYIARSYWIIEGFDISGGANSSLSASHTGITVDGTVGVVVRNNRIHNIATGVCSLSVQGFTGMYISSSAAGTRIENNTIYSIGRLRSGEAGCGNSQNFNDHGIYVEAVPGLTIMRNLFYDVNRGWPIHVFKSGGGATSNLHIYNNVFAGQAPANAPARPEGHIILASTVLNAEIKNNISYDGYRGFVHCAGASGTFSNVFVETNLSDKAIKTANCPPGVIFGTRNLSNTNPGFVSPGTRDYRLTSASAAIDKGDFVAGIAYNGAAPDIGYFELGGQQGGGQQGAPSPPPPRNLRVY